MPIAKHDFEQLMNQARVTLTGASDAGLKGAFYDVVTEFLNDSSAWKQWVQINANTTTLDYVVEPEEGQVIRLDGVTDGVTPIPALMPNVGVVSLRNYPNEPVTYYAKLTCNVSLPTDRAAIPIGPDWLLPKYHVGLLDGLLGKMMIQPAKSYSNRDTGTYHLKKFRNTIANARSAVLRANTVGAQAWRFPQGFSTRTQRGGVPSTGNGNERTF